MNLDECIKRSYAVASLFAFSTTIRGEVLWWRLTHICRVSPVTVARKRISIVNFFEASPSVEIAVAEEDYEITAENSRYTVKQLTYYAINTDSCITSDVEEIERLIEEEATCVKPLRTDIIEFKKVS